MNDLYIVNTMKKVFLSIALITPIMISQNINAQSKSNEFPATEIRNQWVSMKLYLPNPENGYYRATRFDWSGIISSLLYEGHEYFTYWKSTHDPTVHEDLSGPVESYSTPGLGYEEASPGEHFIRIGVGILEKPDEEAYVWSKTYKIIDHGDWTVTRGDDWIEFQHDITSDFGYGYNYIKRIDLKKEKPGFTIRHRLKNTGMKLIETDQFNHNFFTIDQEPSGPAFSISFPFDLSTTYDLKGLMEIEKNELFFIKQLQNNTIFLELDGYGTDITDHNITVQNKKSGAGVTFTVDRPIHRMVFWACETTLSPENYIFLSVSPGEETIWVSDYTLFLTGDR